jgi:hypothetical protein
MAEVGRAWRRTGRRQRATELSISITITGHAFAVLHASAPRPRAAGSKLSRRARPGPAPTAGDSGEEKVDREGEVTNAETHESSRHACCLRSGRLLT